MTVPTKQPPIKIFCGGESSEWMTQLPSGQVRFLSLWGLMKLCWHALMEDRRIVIVDNDGKESDL